MEQSQDRDKQLLEQLKQFVYNLELYKSKSDLRSQAKNLTEFREEALVQNIEHKIEEYVLHRLAYSSPDNTDLPVDIQKQIFRILKPVFGSTQRIKKWFATFSFKLNRIREYINEHRKSISTI